ncbi:MAG: dihydrodipicolinate synthase family protein [Spirochaetales bacterium]|nr:dihydrodipicolinate synthase family protein [Spirochaetales bacterium]
MHNHEKALEVFKSGVVIPATPLAINDDKSIDEPTERLLMRYYLNAGALGIATAVHTTQFVMRDYGLFEPVISIVSDEVDRFEESTKQTIVKVCGVCGPTEQAVSEARIAKKHGFDAVLLSPGGLADKSEDYLVDRTKAVASEMPVIGFYLQLACGGRPLSHDFWYRVAETENVIGIKCASFNRYSTFDVVRAVVESSRCNEITLYTGNDDNIVSDFMQEYRIRKGDGYVSKRFEGGLLGHWCNWTRCAVDLLDKIKEARRTGDWNELVALGPQVTDMNRAIFDPYNGFAGSISGMHEVLRRQGLMKNIKCLDEKERLSEGQAEEITRVISSYPHLIDDEFIAENIGKWINQA